MKKVLCAIVSLCVVASMSFTLVSCGNSKDEGDKSSVSQQEDKKPSDKDKDSDKDEDSDKGSSKKFASVEKMLASPEMKASLETVKKQAQDAGMKLEIYGEGDSIVYSYQYSVQMEASEEMKTALKDALEGQSSVFENVVRMISMQVDVKNPTCIIKYLNADGSEIYVHEFGLEK